VGAGTVRIAPPDSCVSTTSRCWVSRPARGVVICDSVVWWDPQRRLRRMVPARRCCGRLGTVRAAGSPEPEVAGGAIGLAGAVASPPARHAEYVDRAGDVCGGPLLDADGRGPVACWPAVRRSWIRSAP